MKVLNLGELGLVNSMGDDRTIARAAWVSYGKQDSERADEDVEHVINYMMKHRHGSPFEHVVSTYYIKAPIFVAREWFRHRIGSFNEISGRYKTLSPDFYYPDHTRVKGSTNKQGSVMPDNTWLADRNFISQEHLDTYTNEGLTEAYESAYNTYKIMIEDGVANEIARTVLPVGIYTEWWWTVNLRSTFNFLSLRTAENAQYEIRQYAYALEKLVQEQAPKAFAAFEKNGRIAP